jgi:2-oxoglutarate/2-oxoacid ferredoxin oxidoreductase subunit beta
MIADIEPRPALTVKDMKGHTDPDWCPGCGDFGVLHALKTAIAELGLYPNEVLTISGIGCSSNLPGYINTYGMHTLHGRALAVATGAQLANHKLKVIVTGGDGDGYGIGGNHFLHTMRRNVDLTYIVMDNQIYGLTTGQVSPTSIKGMKTKSTPFGSVENEINPIPLAIVGGATYVARGFTGQVRHLTDLIKGGIQHKGFALIDTFSPCVTFNRDNTHEYFRQRTQKLEDQAHDPTDFTSAMQRGYEWGERIPIGLFWKRDDLLSLDQQEPVLDDGVPLARRALGIDAERGRALVRELM